MLPLIEPSPPPPPLIAATHLCFAGHAVGVDPVPPLGPNDLPGRVQVLPALLGALQTRAHELPAPCLHSSNHPTCLLACLPTSHPPAAAARPPTCAQVIISPCYLQLLMSRRAYLRHRVAIIALALLSYVFHPGGGLYRDAVMVEEAQGGRGRGLEALNLLARVAVGSRIPFWLVLALGYQLPSAVFAPLHAALLGAMVRLKPSQPFCAVMQTPQSQPLFHIIANK